MTIQHQLKNKNLVPGGLYQFPDWTGHMWLVADPQKLNGVSTPTDLNDNPWIIKKSSPFLLIEARQAASIPPVNPEDVDPATWAMDFHILVGEIKGWMRLHKDFYPPLVRLS